MDSPPSENQPCPVQFYNFSQLDHKQHCPVYTKIVEREAQEILAIDDISSLESEFLALQHSVQNRINLLESELTVLDNWQVKREYTRKPSFTQPPAKKLKLDGGGNKTKKTKHSKLSSASASSLDSKTAKELGQQDTAMIKVKGDTPDRFWVSVEPYCADITEADLLVLQEGIDSYENREEVFAVPPLGEHYSRRWAVEDLHEEQSESLKLGQMADPLSHLDKEPETQDMDSHNALLEDGESLRKDRMASQQYGPLTERLIAAFIEDPVAGGKSSSSKSQGRRFILPSVPAPGDNTLEERIKEELIALGLLDPPELKESEAGGVEEKDEVLAELLQKQAELTSITEYNRQQRKMLYALAKADMKKQQARAQLKEVDDEIIESLKKISAAKQKRKSLGRKEKDGIWKLLETRKGLLQKVD